MAENWMLQSGLFSGLLNSAETWVAVAYVLGMFTVLAFRPKQIGKPYTFRLSYIFFALYFIVPNSIVGILYLYMSDLGGMGMGRGGNGSFVFVGIQLCGILGKILLGLSIVLALGSLKRHAGTGEQD